jgi:hypothetical protein
MAGIQLLGLQDGTTIIKEVKKVMKGSHKIYILCCIQELDVFLLLWVDAGVSSRYGRTGM